MVVFSLNVEAIEINGESRLLSRGFRADDGGGGYGFLVKTVRV